MARTRDCGDAIALGDAGGRGPVSGFRLVFEQLAAGDQAGRTVALARALVDGITLADAATHPIRFRPVSGPVRTRIYAAGTVRVGSTSGGVRFL
jgi:hypothetical protein